MTTSSAVEWLQLGLLDPLDEERGPVFIGTPLPPTRRTRALFESAIREHARRSRSNRKTGLVLLCFEVSPLRLGEMALQCPNLVEQSKCTSRCTSSVLESVFEATNN